MKSTGIVRKIDEVGRFVIPKELRSTMRFDDGTPVEIYVDGDAIILKRHEIFCVFCGESTDLPPFKGKNICRACLSEIKNSD